MTAAPRDRSRRRELTAVLGAAVGGGLLLLVAEPVVGLVALAGVGAAAMLQPRPRAVLAVVVLLVAAAALWLGVDHADPLLLVGAAFLGLAAATAAVRSRRWPPPRRGGRSHPTEESSARDTWDALDRGEDPTA